MFVVEVAWLHHRVDLYFADHDRALEAARKASEGGQTLEDDGGKLLICTEKPTAVSVLDVLKHAKMQRSVHRAMKEDESKERPAGFAA
jgi:hypothetical protein